MILDILKNSLDYTLKDKIAFIKLSLLSLFSFLIVPFIMIEGYCYRIIKIQLASFINANDPLPSYSNIKELLVDGLKIIFVNFAYSIPIIIAIFLGYNHIINITDSGLTINVSSGALVIAIIFLIGFLTFLFSKVAIVHMIYKKSIYAAFKINELKSLIEDIKAFNYFKFFIGYMILVLGILIILFLVIAFIGSIFQFNYVSVNLYFITLGLDLTILLLIYITVAYPLIRIFESRAIASIYNMRE